MGTRPARRASLNLLHPGQDVMISSRESRGAPKVYSWPQWRQRAHRRQILLSHLLLDFSGLLGTYSKFQNSPVFQNTFPRQQWIYSVLLFAGAAHSDMENDVGELGAGECSTTPSRHAGNDGFVVMGNELACLAHCVTCLVLFYEINYANAVSAQHRALRRH